MKQTSLFNSHQLHNANFTEFAGYKMPIYYKDSGILNEHKAVREDCGIFDVSHMGQAEIIGDKVEELLSNITPTNFNLNNINNAKYTVLLNNDAGIIDDLIFYKLSDNKYFVIFNASRKSIDLDWLDLQASNYNCHVNILNEQSLIAIQGPNAINKVSNILGDDIKDIAKMSVLKCKFENEGILVARTGYTGEDGFEISCSNNKVHALWEKFIANNVLPIGLAARDSLRIEMGFPLYGSDISEKTNLGEINLKWIISSNENFIGKNKINISPKQRRYAIKLLEKGILRNDMEIYDSNQKKIIGIITSGCFSPTLNYSIGQCYIDIDEYNKKTDTYVKIRNNFKKVEILKLSFFKTKK